MVEYKIATIYFLTREESNIMQENSNIVNLTRNSGRVK